MTKFGLGQLKNQTPKWALWIFRIVILLTTVGVYLVSSDETIPDATQVKLLVYLKAVDMFVWGLVKMFGIEPDSIQSVGEKDNQQSDK